MDKLGEVLELPRPNRTRSEIGGDETDLPGDPAPALVSTPIERKAKWRQTFSLKGKGKERADLQSEPGTPLTPSSPRFSHFGSYPATPLSALPSPLSARSTGSNQRYEFNSPGPSPRPASVLGTYVLVDAQEEDGSDSDSSYVLVTQGNKNRNSPIRAKSRAPRDSPKRPLIRTKSTSRTKQELGGNVQPHGTRDSSPVTQAAGQPQMSPKPSISPHALRTALTSIPEVIVPVTEPQSLVVSVQSETSPTSEISQLKDNESDGCNRTSYISEASSESTIKPATVDSKFKLPTPVSVPTTLPGIVAYFNDYGCRDMSSELQEELRTLLPVWSGGLYDVYKQKTHDGTVVAIKTMGLRSAFNSRNQDVLERVARDLRGWTQCVHPNILKLSGLVEINEAVGFVSPWTEKGNLQSYLAENLSADRCQLSIQICQGLQYLHEAGIVHGSLQGSNVLISSAGIPMLTDIGTALLKKYSSEYTRANALALCCPRWTAPEVVRGQSICTMMGDVYSLGTTILETFTGQVPYCEMSDHLVLSMFLFTADEPPKPGRLEDMTHTANINADQLWELLIQCWLYAPEKRPNAANVTEIMKTLSPNLDSV